MAFHLFLQVPLRSASDVRLAPTSPAVNAGATLGPPYNLILDPNSDTPYDQAASGWVIGAVGSGPSFVIAGTEISGVITQ